MVTNECSPLFVKIYRKRNNGNVIKECILSLLLDVYKANLNWNGVSFFRKTMRRRIHEKRYLIAEG